MRDEGEGPEPPPERAGIVGGLEGREGVTERVEVVVAVLGQAPERIQLGEHEGEKAQPGERAHGRGGTGGGEDTVHLRLDPLGARPREPERVPADEREGLPRDRELGDLGREPDRAQHPERIVLEDPRRQRTDPPAPQVATAPAGVEQSRREGIVGDRVQPEVPAQDLAPQRSRTALDEVPFAAVRADPVIDDATLAEGDDPMPDEAGERGEEPARGSDRAAPAAASGSVVAHLGDEVEIARLAPEREVADRAADEEDAAAVIAREAGGVEHVRVGAREPLQLPAQIRHGPQRAVEAGEPAGAPEGSGGEASVGAISSRPWATAARTRSMRRSFVSSVSPATGISGP